MLLDAIVGQLGALIPRYTGKFSDNLPYSSLDVVNGIATVTTPAPHGFNPFKKDGITPAHPTVTISNMMVKRNIVELTQEDGIAFCRVDTAHDLTENYQPAILIEGVNESVYNGSHKMLEVPNRFTFTFEIDPAAPNVASGSAMKFVEYLEVGIDGAYPITITGPTTFTFDTGEASFNFGGYYGTIAVNHRVMGAANFGRFQEIYNTMALDSYWACVCMDDATASKNRAIPNDSLTSLSAYQDFRQVLIEPFTVYVMAPAKTDIAALSAINDMYGEARTAILRSILGSRFPTGFNIDSYSGAAFYGHGQIMYDKAVYAHQFQFETVKEITMGDGIYSDSAVYKTRAFRDFNLQLQSEFGKKLLYASINLDDDPDRLTQVNGALLTEGDNYIELEDGSGILLQ